LTVDLDSDGATSAVRLELVSSTGPCLLRSPRRWCRPASGSGRVEEDFAILLDLQAAASGIQLKSEDVEVDDGLSAANEGN
jgi:hypothetical protein